MKLRIRHLGRSDYAATWQEQLALCEAKHRLPEQPDELWLLEHDPVYTIGRTPDQSSLGVARDLPHPVFEINRGGQATFHGPGQMVGYPILDLRLRNRDLHRHLRDLESCIIETLAGYNVRGTQRAGFTGVWVGGRKIASIGVGVKHWVSMHGFALNVCNDLSPFLQITPCGIAGVEMTSLARETGQRIGVEEVASLFSERFPTIFGYGEVERIPRASASD